MTLTVTLHTNLPADGLTCPGDKVLLTCNITAVVTNIQPGSDVNSPGLTWQILGTTPRVYYIGGLLSAETLGHFKITAFSSGLTSISNATIQRALLSNNNITIECLSANNVEIHITKTVMIVGKWKTIVITGIS